MGQHMGGMPMGAMQPPMQVPAENGVDGGEVRLEEGRQLPNSTHS